MEISSRPVATNFSSLTFMPIGYQVAWSKRNKRGFSAGKPLDCICKSLSPATQKKVFVCNLDQARVVQFVGSNCCLFTLISQYQLIDASRDRILRGMVNFVNFRMNISDISSSVDWISRLKCVTHRRFEKKVPLLLGQTMRLFGPKIGILRPNLPRPQAGRNTRYDEFVPRGSVNYAFMTPRAVAMWKYVTYTFERNTKAI